MFNEFIIFKYNAKTNTSSFNAKLLDKPYPSMIKLLSVKFSLLLNKKYININDFFV